MGVIIYTLQGCPVCERAKRALREQGVAFEERRVDQDERWWEEARKYSSAVPVILWREDDVEIGWEGEHGWEFA